MDDKAIKWRNIGCRLVRDAFIGSSFFDFRTSVNGETFAASPTRPTRRMDKLAGFWSSQAQRAPPPPSWAFLPWYALCVRILVTDG